MQLKYADILIKAQPNEHRITSMAWSPNNLKLAIATSDRQLVFYDDAGKRRDKFSTKPANSDAGKKSYLIRSIAFSPDSTKLAVAQSDCIVFIYKLGEGFAEKKKICNKFPQPSPPICLAWLASGALICGLTCGKVRTLELKTNKSHTLYSSGSVVVSVTSNFKGNGFLSGHADGNIIRFYVLDDQADAKLEPAGRVCTHPVPPSALVQVSSGVVAAGCDKKVVMYSSTGKILTTFDYSRDAEEDFSVACCVTGQGVAIGGWNKVRLFSWNTRKQVWIEDKVAEIKDMYLVSALAWKKDGSKLMCGCLSGAVIVFESVLRRSVWKNKFEIIYVAPTQVLIKTLDDTETPGIVLRSYLGREIDEVSIMGRDRYIIGRTEDTLLIGDLEQNLLSEIPWNSIARKEKFYFENPTVCLIFNAGELSLVEYGENTILTSVRTEFINPHVISVRLNERPTVTADNKKLAYLLDLKTICIIDLINASTINQISHDSRIDWLELSETAHRLLFRDKKRRLLLVNTETGEKLVMFSSVNFVQWVTGSDVAVAQSRSNLLIWYNIDLPDHPTVIPVVGAVIDVIRENGKTEAITKDGHNAHTYELDEGLVEFGTAIHDNDYGRAVLFLETIGNKAEADTMWHNLANIALNMRNLNLAERCYAALGDVAKTFYIQETSKIAEQYDKDPEKNVSLGSEITARIAIISNDLSTAEAIYLEQGEIENAINMYKGLHRWEDSISLAERRGYPKIAELKEEYMSLLLRTNQNDKAGQILEERGEHEEAIKLYLKSSRPIRAGNLIVHNNELLNNETIVGTVIKKLLQNELFELTAEIYEKLEKTELAMECYRKGKIWSKAVELARTVSPDKVILLEEEWGDHLVEERQLDAAINHYIEAGRTKKALEIAVEAKQWKKAVHIIEVIDDAQSVEKYYDLLAQQFATMQEYETAEKLYSIVEKYHEAVEMYNNAGEWEKAQNIASKYLDQSDVSDMYIKQAQELESKGKYREAEKLYLSINEPDLAIGMYKRHDQFESMIRMVEKFHPDLLNTTHLHLAQQLESQGKHRAAEIHYLSADEWKSALNMYRALSMWEEAYRVAKQNGSPAAANQVAFIWARTLPIDSAIKLLNKYGLLEACIDYACETYQFDFAFQLCNNLSTKKLDVHYKYAMALEDDGKFAEAETEFILADKPKEAVLMYIHGMDWVNALRVAEAKIPQTIPDVLRAHAEQCFEEKQFNEYETLMLRAQMPEQIIQKYKDIGMWVDALRVCRNYLPSLFPSLQAEYSRSDHSKSTVTDLETLLSRANEWIQASQYRNAIECLLQVNKDIADPSIVRRALLRAADLVHKFLVDKQALEVTKVLAPRLLEIEENITAAQLFLGVDMIKEAIDTFIFAEDWERARKVAKELEPAYEHYVEEKYKASLKQEGKVEQLADIDIIGALDLLAEQGQWARCLEKAKSHSIPILHKYVALNAAELLKDGYTLEALALYVEYGAPPISQNFNIYTRICLDVFSMASVANNYSVWAQLRRVLFELDTGLSNLDDVHAQIRHKFRTLLLIIHFYTLRVACREVHSLNVIAVKLSTALLRYTDIIPADKGFYEAGVDLRSQGRESEAFVFLNHYLDICEAIEEGEASQLDHSELQLTDFPTSIPLPATMYLKNEPRVHDEIKEWVLAISIDQKVEQSLPISDRNLYESCLLPGEMPCVLTGYPITGQQPVTFTKSNLKANRDIWTKLVMAGKMSPQSNIPNVLSFLEEWLGHANSMLG